MKRAIQLVIVILLAAIISSGMLKHHLERCKVQQARDNLVSVELCMDGTLGKPDKERFEICTAGSKTTTTGDVYVLSLTDLEFVHDNSLDVPRNEKLYFTEESVGQYFKDWNSAKEALIVITSHVSSSGLPMTSYNYDGGTELLEWNYYGDPVAHGVRDYKYIIVQGIQKDEVAGKFMGTGYVLIGFVLLICMMILRNGIASCRCDECQTYIK